MRTAGWLKISGMYVTGSVLYALSVSAFSTPNDIAPGGATGLAVLVHALIGLPVGLTVLLINIPLLTAAFLGLSRGYAWRTAAVLLGSSVLMDVLAPLIPPFTQDRLLAALGGGLTGGVGVGLILLGGASTGGSEIAAALWQKRRPHLSTGRCLLLIDAAVIALAVPVFGELSASLYAAVGVFVSTTAVDRLLSGREEGRLLLIVTDHRDEVVGAVTSSLRRGVTVVRATGGYSGEERPLLLCAVSRLELPRLKRLTLAIDPRAFLMVVTTQQVFGKGFLSESG